MVVLWLKVQEHLLVISLMLIPLPLSLFVVYFCSGGVDLLEPFGLLLISPTLIYFVFLFVCLFVVRKIRLELCIILNHSMIINVRVHLNTTKCSSSI